MVAAQSSVLLHQVYVHVLGWDCGGQSCAARSPFSLTQVPCRCAGASVLLVNEALQLIKIR